MLFIFSIRIAFTSPDNNSPFLYLEYISSNFWSLCSKYFSHWQATSISTFPPNFLCSSIVSCPPEKAYLFIFFFTSLGESVIRMDFASVELPCLPSVPVNGDINFAWIIAGFLWPSFWMTSLEILK